MRALARKTASAVLSPFDHNCDASFFCEFYENAQSLGHQNWRRRANGGREMAEGQFHPIFFQAPI